MANVKAVTAESFEMEVLKADQPVLVDVWATWCPPCRRLMPIVDAVAEKYAGRLKVVKCDYDSNPEVASKYNILSIPHLLFFKGGELAGQQIGFASESELSAKVDEVLAKS